MTIKSKYIFLAIATMVVIVPCLFIPFTKRMNEFSDMLDDCIDADYIHIKSERSV